jgi:hypothetical protein
MSNFSNSQSQRYTSRALIGSTCSPELWVERVTPSSSKALAYFSA